MEPKKLSASEEVFYATIISSCINAMYIMVLLLPSVDLHVKVIVSLALLISNLIIMIRVIDIVNTMNMTIHDLIEDIREKR